MNETAIVNSRITHSLGTYLVLRKVTKRMFVVVPELPLASSTDPAGYIYPVPRLVKFMGDFIQETFSPALQIRTLQPMRIASYDGSNN